MTRPRPRRPYVCQHLRSARQRDHRKRLPGRRAQPSIREIMERWRSLPLLPAKSLTNPPGYARRKTPPELHQRVGVGRGRIHAEHRHAAVPGAPTDHLACSHDPRSWEVGPDADDLAALDVVERSRRVPSPSGSPSLAAGDRESSARGRQGQYPVQFHVSGLSCEAGLTCSVTTGLFRDSKYTPVAGCSAVTNGVR